MRRRRVQVECYAGGRADEYPRRVITTDRVYTVARLVGASIKEDSTSKERSCHFTVQTREGLVLCVVRAVDGEWYLESEA